MSTSPVPPRRKVVISSVTGEPLDWTEEEQKAEEPPRPTAHEADLLRELPPHWGRGQ